MKFICISAGRGSPGAGPGTASSGVLGQGAGNGPGPSAGPAQLRRAHPGNVAAWSEKGLLLASLGPFFVYKTMIHILFHYWDIFIA